ncbi:MAG: hypothetical protein RIQ93_3172 [Verrucomicrobiota bacterium]|jgi:hypothetical protein
MRPKHPRAAESGVGKYTARESESAQVCAVGKERVANAHPHKLAPEPSKSSGAFFLPFFRGAPQGSAAAPRAPDPTVISASWNSALRYLPHEFRNW